jgi:hypothetical protein
MLICIALVGGSFRMARETNIIKRRAWASKRAADSMRECD